jgi:hypothetical protein
VATGPAAIRDKTAGPRPLPAAERKFFSAYAVAFLATVLIGFAQTYYLRPILPAPARPLRPLSPLLHVHGVLFTGWMLLLVAQTRLIAARRVDLHRRVGVAGGLLAVAMVVVGVISALHAVLRGASPPGIEPRRFLVVPLAAITLFALFLAAALLARRDAQTHKRLIILANLALLPPALARWLIFYFGFGPPLVFAVATLYLVPLVVWDLTRWKRLHPVTLWGGLLLVLSGPGRFALGQTDAWLAFADWAVGLVR